LIVVFYAFAREIAPFKRRIGQNAPLGLEGLQGFRAEVGAKEFIVVGHGIGHGRAADAARHAFDHLPAPELVIGTGVVGALSSGLKPGDLVLSDRVLAIASDGRPADAFAIDDTHLRGARRSLAMARIEYSTGAILTAHRVLATGAEKRRAKESTGAIAVDMESAALAAEAVARGIPFLALRAVLDEVDDEVFGAEMTDEEGNVRPIAATSFLMRHPATLLKLPRMVRNLSLATDSIADALTAIAHEGNVPGSVSRARAQKTGQKRPR
jgi:adenosylhomocysteine nucleosidase